MSPADIILEKALLPTHLDTQAIREQIAADIRRRSIFSAQTYQEAYLQEMQQVLADVASGKMNDATARMKLKQWLDGSGYTPDQPNSLTDLGSTRRLQLILDTQTKMAANVANLDAETPESLDESPAWELTRIGVRRVPRSDWQQRWQAAGDSVGWQGAIRSPMVARKDSPIWAALGSGVGGFDDALGNPYPPFAFSSSMGWLPLMKEEAQSYGLDLGSPVTPEKASLTPNEEELSGVLDKMGPDFLKQLMQELS
jgi:hypothetical protein